MCACVRACVGLCSRGVHMRMAYYFFLAVAQISFDLQSSAFNFFEHRYGGISIHAGAKGEINVNRLTFKFWKKHKVHATAHKHDDRQE